MKDYKNILIIKMSSLGDVIHALPTLYAVRKNWPDARITWAIHEQFASLLPGTPWVDDVIIIDTPPVLSVTDAVVLAEKSDGVILVVKNEVASPKDLIEAKKRLSQVGIPLLGSIVIDA